MQKDANYKNTPGGRVREVRKEKNLTQAELASMIFRESFQTISNIENNRNKLTRENAVKIAEICGCTPEYLLCESDSKHYVGDVLLAITKMQRYADMIDTFLEYISTIAGFDQCPLSKDDASELFKDVAWYAKARLMKMTEEKGENSNG